MLGGTELANEMRTLVYAKNLGCSTGVSVAAAHRRVVGNEHYTALYLSGYDGPRTYDYVTIDPNSAESLECYCAAIDTGPYISPADDPAPWYVAGNSDSESFLGLLVKAKLSDPYTRGMTARMSGGSVLGPLMATHRVIEVQGYLLALDDAGVAYGSRWVTEVLRGQLCAAGCVPDDLCIATHCQAGGLRMLRGVGVIDGPVIAGVTEDVDVQSISFQLAAELPYLFAEPTIEIDGSIAAGADETAIITTPEWVADMALVVTIEAGTTAATDLRITGNVAVNGTCPDTNTPPCIDISIPSLPANSRITIDATRRLVTWTDPVALEEKSGLYLLEWTRAFPWPEVPACTSLCLTIDNGGATAVTATVSAFGREI